MTVNLTYLLHLGAVHQRGQCAGDVGQLDEERSLFRRGLQQLHQEKVGATIPRYHQQYCLWSSGAVKRTFQRVSNIFTPSKQL